MSTAKVEKYYFNVELLIIICNITSMRLAYGYNRKEKDFAELNITAGKFFLDNKHSGFGERLDMIKCCREGVTVVVLSMADFGKGRSQNKIVNAIKGTGASLEVVEGNTPKGDAGRPGTVNFDTDEDLKEALFIWSAMPDKAALAEIGKRFGKWPDRNRMNYLKRKSAKK